MLDIINKRRQAYEFINEKLNQAGCKSSCHTAKMTDGDVIISLTEIDSLKRGYIDPSKELITMVKSLIRHVSSEAEIEEYLVKPFLRK